jgi:O-acetyl-ADP-ribose deacetylase (regulator of RNase III)
MRVRVVHGGVLDVEAEAVVNAANTELRHGGGVAAAIARAAGPDLDRESRAVGYCPLGSAVATTAGRLRAKVVVHVPTIDYREGGRPATAAELQAGVERALALARAHGCRSVAFPILGAGVAGFAPSTACRLLREAFARAEAAGEGPEEVWVCAYSAADRAAAREVWGPADEARGPA